MQLPRIPQNRCILPFSQIYSVLLYISLIFAVLYEKHAYRARSAAFASSHEESGLPAVRGEAAPCAAICLR
jgi:hypothetical protein